MVHQGVPLMNWDQMIEDHREATKRTPTAEEQLPAYTNAVKGQSPAYIQEKEIANERSKQSKQPSKMSTFKSILTGDVHKHNPRYVLEESLTGQSTRSTSPKTKDSKSASSKSTSSPSTLKSILTGDVHKHHPMYRLEESVDERMRR